MTVLIAIGIFALIAVYYSRRYAWWKPAVSYQHPRILMYHMVREPIPGAKFNSLRVSPEVFRRQLEYLSEHGWTFFTMSELMNNKHSLPEKSVALTFDDGYADNLLNALPILKRYQAKATIYLVVDRHNREWSSKRKKKHNNKELMLEPKLSDQQVRELLDSGLVEIGSHTMTHDNLPTLLPSQKKFEIIDSKKNLENTFRIECKSFCYPFGLFDDEDRNLVKKANYTSATTVEKGISNIQSTDPYLLKRITISGKDNFLAFLLKLKTGKRGIRK